MDIKRVKQILSSSSRIDVMYEGMPVWIDSCDEQSGVAQVHDVSSPGESIHVDVAALEEK
ncbi:H-type small acid-soluble spore protein [Bacillus clarus]|uniref:Small, acid-soluble spore protein H n=1 Tax=Bacillus clarus TaxID=2338372 RepID=A0A090YX87_9BACI|nr:acid-soluble spore protein H [Bacillus clarus]KFN02713.1 small acid-soluble spore, H-type family protein [Bacillus clarus]RFT66570.1 H-type small acid-soluble spore protein [Bacillus clarus]